MRHNMDDNVDLSTHNVIDVTLIAVSTALLVCTLPLVHEGVKHTLLIASNMFEFLTIIAALMSLISIGNYKFTANTKHLPNVTIAAGASLISLLLAGILVFVFELI